MMKVALSYSKLESFCGNIIPLRLLGVEEYGMEDITWRLEGDCVQMKEFTEPPFNSYDDGDFTDGVLITFLFPGNARVIASYQGEEYVCEISVREMKKATGQEKMNFYIGDMHIHTSTACSKANAKKILTSRSDGSSPEEVVDMIRDEGKMQFHVITDHGDLLDRRQFFRGFTAAERSGDTLSVFPGSECDIFSIERDRYGLFHNNANEVVCLNAATYVPSDSYREFLDGYVPHPYTICNIAHPNFYGFGSLGVGDFSFYKNCSPRFRQMVRFVEIGDGTDRGGNLVHEYVYSLALDNGFTISTSCSSDSHTEVWGYERIPGKTVIMATENTKEALLDALMNSRAYASSSGNIKLSYTVNGLQAPVTLPLAKKYSFHVEIGYFYEDPTTVPVACEVISNGGVSLKTIEGVDFSSFDFDLESDSASWFYLRLWDSEGRKTWSVPVWTGRAPYQATNDDLYPIDKKGFTAIEEGTEKNASILLCDDPYKTFTASSSTCSILIDMKEEKNLYALGHYPPVLLGKQMKEVDIQPKHYLAEFPCHFAISTSLDGENFTPCAEGVFRMSGKEEIIRFACRKARYIRLEILSTVGKNSHRKEFENALVTMAELTPFTKWRKADSKAYYLDKMEKMENPLKKRELKS
jgi:hypothetical protein